MSTLTRRETSTRLATLPKVNLLPPEIGEQRRAKRVQTGLGVGVLAAAGVVGAMFLVANGQVGSAQDQLDASTQRGAQLQSQANKYAEVPLVYAQVEAGESTLQLAMGKEVRWSRFLNDMSIRTPGKVWLTRMTVVQDLGESAVTAPAVPTTGYLTPGIGSVSFVGSGRQHNDVAAFLDALAKQNGLNQPYFTKSAVEPIDGQDVVKFDSQATVTEDALSGRYTKAGS
jgi:Tfp pilus assembly protein PilN